MTRACGPQGRVLTAALICAMAAAVLLDGGRPEALVTDSQRTFRGHLVGDPNASVLLRQGTGNQSMRRGRFEARNIPLLCDDGSVLRVERKTGDVRFGANGTFVNRYSSGISEGYESFFRLEGRVRSRGRAEGTIFVYQDPLDPPTEPQAPECSTAEPLRWKATRRAVR